MIYKNNTLKHWGQTIRAVLLFVVLIGVSCKEAPKNGGTVAAKEALKVADQESEQTGTPLYRTSITATDIDFIRASDTDAFKSLAYVEQGAREMPGSESGELMDPGTFVFQVNFKEGKDIEIWAHSAFGTINAAKVYADKLGGRLGKLPLYMRNKLSHVVLHKGDSNAFAEDAGGFFVLYSENMDERISTNDLEETVFHEAVHVAFDLAHAKSKEWKEAQKNDGVFITEYAQSRPEKEDLAESAIFVYTKLTHPGRLDDKVVQWMETNIPNRLVYIEDLFEKTNKK
ncbi:hypothetical protein [Maribacter sp. 2307ULW6-5]|uniref:hypothetical protein n=1 Tax=Maribacter sp. 2307ULW6-5 TaxID=3386275 RepID=UPI0039BD1F81